LLTVGWSCGLLGCGAADRPEPGREATATGGIERPAWFTEVTKTVGVDFRHESGADGKLYMPETRRSGPVHERPVLLLEVEPVPVTVRRSGPGELPILVDQVQVQIAVAVRVE
jgi:hypothetical protein